MSETTQTFHDAGVAVDQMVVSDVLQGHKRRLQVRAGRHHVPHRRPQHVENANLNQHKRDAIRIGCCLCVPQQEGGPRQKGAERQAGQSSQAGIFIVGELYE